MSKYAKIYGNLQQKSLLKYIRSWNSFHINNNVASGTFFALKPFYVQTTSKEELTTFLCKIHLHMRKAVNTFLALCDKQKIGIDFHDYQLFEIIQDNMSIGVVIIKKIFE